MGMDVYGLNPTIHEEMKPPERPKNMHNGASRKAIDKYFEEQQAYENKNAGTYFRNNCWWWRPLADLIIKKCDWITQEQQQRLHDNSGFEFSEHEALTIAKTLRSTLRSGEAKQVEEKNKQERKIASEWNKKLNKQHTTLKKEAIKRTGNKDIAPCDYPADLNKKWDDLSAQRDRRESYPFAVKNVREFVKFLSECGGFKVC